VWQREGREKKRENKERKKTLNQTEQTNSRLAEEMAEHKTHHHAVSTLFAMRRCSRGMSPCENRPRLTHL
jgi:hypothetical protein